jgi:hypothetical protein
MKKEDDEDDYPHEEEPPPSPPIKLVTPSHRSRLERQNRPLLYQVYGSAPAPRSVFPGGFSPVRTSRPLQHSVATPTSSSLANQPESQSDLYASFSPPRVATLRARHGGSPSSGNQRPSIFRPKQASIIVARGGSHDDNSSVTFASKHATPSPVASACPSKDRVLTFPSKLHQILSAPEYQEFITW